MVVEVTEVVDKFQIINRYVATFDYWFEINTAVAVAITIAAIGSDSYHFEHLPSWFD